jgi:hypothetical protein
MKKFVLSLLVFGFGVGFVGGVLAQSAGPFMRLQGQWSGGGTIEFSNGAREPLRCRAAYDVLGRGRDVQLNIRCASPSYNFDLRGQARNDDGSISGNWSEATTNAAGGLSGRAEGSRIRVRASSQTFSANLSLTTHKNRQSVVIKSQNPQSRVIAATIDLRRS